MRRVVPLFLPMTRNNHRMSVDHEASLVRPMVHARTPKIGAGGAVIAGVQPDLDRLRRDLDISAMPGFPVASSRIYPDLPPADAALAGPVLGAPHAAMLLECLIAWGATRLIFWGWCGAVLPGLEIGDVIMPEAAISDEGTSGHYGAGNDGVIPRFGPADPALIHSLEAEGVAVDQRPVWSTDAIFRETPSKIRRFREGGAIAVDMETSAMFSVSNAYRVPLTVVLVVSDDVSGTEWKRGFRDPRFLDRRERLSRCLARLITEPAFSESSA